MGHKNAEVLRKLDDALLAGDTEAFFAGYTDDVVVHIGGANKLTGDYKGLEQLQELFGRYMEAAGEFSFEPHAYLADDEHGVVLQRTTLSKGSKTLTTNDAFINHFRGDKISEFWIYPDDQAAFDAWVGK